MWNVFKPHIVFAFATLLAGTAGSCQSTVHPGARSAQEGDWLAWRDLSPLLEVAKSHAPDPAVTAIREASALLRQDKAKTADARLTQASDASGREWVAVARADLAALNFSVCIRGIAWRLFDGPPPNPTERDVDFSTETELEPGDVSVEALLTNLDAAVASNIPALVMQARIARVRVAAFANRCAANEDVEAMTQETMEADLATLAAEQRLTPDLAYLWAGIQMNRFSGNAARPFLLQAKEGGFDHPAVTFMLAVVAFENRELDRADELARDAVTKFEATGAAEDTAQAWFLRGEVERIRSQEDPSRAAVARSHYAKALELDAAYVPALFASARLDLDGGELRAAKERMAAGIDQLLLEGSVDAERLPDVGRNLESLVMLADDLATVQLTRDALLFNIDVEPDPGKRALRYLYAAALETRLQDFDMALGHGVLAKEEFAEAELQPPMDIDEFLARVRGGGA